MYKQIYTIPFKSIEENSYNIIIEKKGFAGSSKELTGASSPFVVEVDLESPLKPFRLSTATLSIFGGDYLQSLFTPDPQGVRVKLLKNGSVEWLGFITNDTYSQDYSNIEFAYEIELVNPLSTLKHSKYESLSVNKTFIELIKEAITETNSEIKTLYLPSSYTNELDENIYNLIKVSSDNFVDEQDEAMSYYEILEEIAKYLGLTITVYKDAVYFIDYIGIGKGFNGYHKYDLISNAVTTATLTHTETIQSLDYVSDSSSLQINSGRNKAKVTCSLYDIEEILPEFDAEGAKYLFAKRSLYRFENEGEVTSTAFIVRFFEQDKFTFYKYGYDGVAVNPPAEGGDRPTPDNPWDEDDDKSQDRIKGSWFVRTANYPLLAIMSRERTASLHFTNEVLVRRYSDLEQAKLGKELGDVPIFTMKSEKSINFRESTPLILNFDVKFHRDKLEYWETNDKKKGWSYLPYVDMLVSLKVGDLYYNGLRWINTFSKFKTRVLVNKEDFYGQYFSAENTNDFSYGLTDDSGKLIVTPDEFLNGKIELTFYNPEFKDVMVLNKPNTYITYDSGKSYPQYMYLKNIQLTHSGKKSGDIYGDKEDEKSKNDITYENDIDERYIDEPEEVDLKICTYPEDYFKLCYSTTFINDKYLKTLKYNPLNLTEIPENILLHKMIDYLKEPKYEVSIPVSNKELYPYSIITDKNLPNKRFIYAGSEIDYEYEKNTINILEI